MRNIIVFGHDPRMESVAGYFYHLGYDVYENPEEPVADACVITARTYVRQRRRFCVRT